MGDMSPFLPPVQTALWLAAQRAAVHFAGPSRQPSAVERAGGLGGIVVGVSLAVVAVGTFARRRTTWHPWSPHHSRALVTTGPNALSRNPMYLGMVVSVAGAGVLTGAPWSSLAAAGLVASLTPQIRREEKALAANFEAEWAAYAARVRRWV